MLVLHEYLALNIIYNLHLIKLPNIFLSRTNKLLENKYLCIYGISYNSQFYFVICYLSVHDNITTDLFRSVLGNCIALK